MGKGIEVLIVTFVTIGVILYIFTKVIPKYEEYKFISYITSVFLMFGSILRMFSSDWGSRFLGLIIFIISIVLLVRIRKGKWEKMPKNN